jgi:hypothetical protein
MPDHSRPVQPAALGWLVFILLLSAVLRFHALGQAGRFHPDEALYTTFSRSAVVYGEWMLPGVLDKPPLSLYASAVSIHFLGRHHIVDEVYGVDLRQGEFAARLPNVFASILLTALVYALAKALFGYSDCRGTACRARVPLLAAFFTACSPFIIVFSATAFTDMLMLLCAIFGLLLAARRRPAWSGVFLALSVAAKPQGIFYLPLVLGVLFYNYWCVGTHGCASAEQTTTPPKISNTRTRLALITFRFSFTFITGIALLLYWDAARPETSIFVLGSDHYTIEYWLIPLETWGARLSTWLDYAGWLLGPPIMTWALVLVGVAGVIVVGKGAFRFWGKEGISPADTKNRVPTSERRDGIFAVRHTILKSLLSFPNTPYIHRMDLLLWAFIIGYFGLHWLGGFSIYDRYLLPVAPLLAIVAARGVGLASLVVSRRGGSRTAPTKAIFLGITVSALAITSWQAASWHFDLGRDHYPLDRDGEIIQLAQYLDDKPVATIIYDPWLGWEMGYYLGVWSDKRHVHYPDPQALVADALLVPETGLRYFIAPSHANTAPWVEALEQVGFVVNEDYRTPLFRSFRLLPPAALSLAS